ncbi:M15 family metallopeptidase [Leucobacter allii]|uniref:M15 family metallopeptidase n=1 Tax=Leucobacter allii TaxID=2932247 RepID=A0ABY4FNS3_9MICO|nr:M15 family metallopeptidase [Leucobacter allii]UOQ57932.1 M15 family metallopeptidase [Leucobacter allii]
MARPHRRLLGAAALACAATLALSGCAPEPDPAPAPSATPEPSRAPTPTPEAAPAPEFDRTAHSIDDPASVWVVSNKLRPLDPVDFAPADLVMPEGVENEFAQPLRAEAARAVEAFIAAAAAEGHGVRIISAYRDYATQVSLYDGYVARDGQEAADAYSARPGHSEHQTGLVVDLDDHGDCYLAACFADTPAGSWLAEHAAEHGFIVRYPAGKQEVTGFMPEPWHFRYVGTGLAQEMRSTGTATLEEFFGLPAAPGYAA